MGTIGKARALRREQTEVESKLWQRLRAKRLDALKFRRQHPVGPYIADFACVALKLIVELDGGQHGDDAVRAYDGRRTGFLAAQGWRVLRFWNNEVNEDIDGVVYAVECALRERR